MKILNRLALAGLILVLIAGSVMAGKPRKLQPGTYISSVKIEIIGYADKQEKERINLAIAMLDSLFMHYGPHSEGYYWYSQIQWDLVKEKSDLKERLPLVERAIAYADSLKWSCGNKDINKKYRKKCEDLDEEMDSIRVIQWRDYYNDGVGQITEVEELMETVKVETDSSALAFYQTRLDALVDSCQDNMALAVVIDSTDAKPFIGLANVNEKIGDFKKAIEYLKRALPKAENRTQILTEIAYDFIQENDYCSAIPWFSEYVDSMTISEPVMQDPKKRAAVLSTAHNLAICYNNCKEFDSAYGIFQRIISFDPEDVQALVGAGRYHQHKGREASDSARTYREQEDEAADQSWNKVRDARFDSATVYLKQAFEFKNDDADIAAEYGLMAAIRQNYEDARVAFGRACELKPDDADNWISLGDCCLSLHDWTCSAEAYEHVVELQPNNKSVWERLADLYQQLGDETRRAEILQKLDTM